MGEKVTKDHAIADAFNDFFSNVGNNLDRKIDHQNTNVRQYLKTGSTAHSSLHQFWNQMCEKKYWNWKSTKPVGQMI